MDILPVWAAVLAAVFLPAVAQASPLTLSAALDLAQQRSEAARAGRAGQTGAAEMARAAGQLPDPTLDVGIENLPVTGADALSTRRDSMTMKRIGIHQEWLSREKRAARTAAAAAVEGRAAVQAAAAVAGTRLRTALAYADAYYAERLLALTTLMEHHAHEELQAAQGRLASATGDSAEVLTLAAASGAAEDESSDVRQTQNTALVDLERWTGVIADELSPPDEAPPVTEAAYVASHPNVMGLGRAAEVARREATVTASERSPNWTWGLSYGQRTGYSDMVSFGVSVPIPLSPHERQDRETGAKLALADEAEAELNEATRAAHAEYRTLVSDIRRLQDRIARYRAGVLAPAAQRIAVATAAYAASGSTLVALFEARHAEVDAERKLLSLQRDLTRAQLRLALTPQGAGAGL